MASIIAVCKSSEHNMAKQPCDHIKLIAGLGIEGDCHAGKTVQHLSRVKVTPDLPNLRQVHLISQEVEEELHKQFPQVIPGSMGENITTKGIDLINLPTGTKLQLGEEAIIEIQGLRNPCPQLDGVSKGLNEACKIRDAEGNIIVRKAGIMGTVLVGGIVKPNDTITITLPAEPHQPLKVV